MQPKLRWGHKGVVKQVCVILALVVLNSDPSHELTFFAFTVCQHVTATPDFGHTTL